MAFLQSRSRRSLTIMIGVAAMISVGAIMVTRSGSAQSAASPVAPSPTALSEYSVFDRSATSADVLPAVSPSEVDQTSNETITRALPPVYPAFQRWATLKGDRVCIIHRFVSSTAPAGPPDEGRVCNNASQLAQEHQILVSMAMVNNASATAPRAGLTNLISGLTPDGVSSVQLVFTDGSRDSVSVEENSFVLSLGNTPRELAHVYWTDGSGQSHSE